MPNVARNGQTSAVLKSVKHARSLPFATTTACSFLTHAIIQLSLWIVVTVTLLSLCNSRSQQYLL